MVRSDTRSSPSVLAALMFLPLALSYYFERTILKKYRTLVVGDALKVTMSSENCDSLCSAPFILVPVRLGSLLMWYCELLRIRGVARQIRTGQPCATPARIGNSRESVQFTATFLRMGSSALLYMICIHLLHFFLVLLLRVHRRGMRETLCRMAFLGLEIASGLSGCFLLGMLAGVGKA